MDRKRKVGHNPFPLQKFYCDMVIRSPTSLYTSIVSPHLISGIFIQNLLSLTVVITPCDDKPAKALSSDADEGAKSDLSLTKRVEIKVWTYNIICARQSNQIETPLMPIRNIIIH